MSESGARSVTDLSAQIRQALADLELVSHAPIQGYNFAPNEVGRGERWRVRDTRPPIAHLGQHSPKGGDTTIPRGTDVEHPDRRDADEIEAWRASYHRRTVSYFRVRLEERGESLSLLGEIRETTAAWRRQPIPKGQPPAMGDPMWKRWVGESTKDGGELARLFGVTRQYIHQVRKAYRDVDRGVK